MYFQYLVGKKTTKRDDRKVSTLKIKESRDQRVRYIYPLIRRKKISLIRRYTDTKSANYRLHLINEITLHVITIKLRSFL